MPNMRGRDIDNFGEAGLKALENLFHMVDNSEHMVTQLKEPFEDVTFNVMISAN